jgi:hypothetical protein
MSRVRFGVWRALYTFLWHFNILLFESLLIVFDVLSLMKLKLSTFVVLLVVFYSIILRNMASSFWTILK